MVELDLKLRGPQGLLTSSMRLAFWPCQEPGLNPLEPNHSRLSRHDLVPAQLPMPQAVTRQAMLPAARTDMVSRKRRTLTFLGHLQSRSLTLLNDVETGSQDSVFLESRNGRWVVDMISM